MTILAGIGFTAPWLLLALLALPVLWVILRAVPPAPVKRRFPGVALLLGLKDADTVSDRTPWWLLVLRMLAVGLIILGLAGPVLNPDAERADGDGPLLVVLDATWAGARNWAHQLEAIDAQLSRAARAGRPVAILSLSQPELPQFQTAEIWRNRLAGLSPAPWHPSADALAPVLSALRDMPDFDTAWFGDGLDYEARDSVRAAVQAKGRVDVFQTARPVLALAPATYLDGAVHLTARRSTPGPARDITLLAQGRDPAGTARTLASATATFEEGKAEATAALVLPAELRARITRFDIANGRSAGATTLVDDGLRRREVALIAGRENREGLELLSPLHYLEKALIPTAELLQGGLADVLPANPDVIILADVATLSSAEEKPLLAWVAQGGLLVRFAGPRVAASTISRDSEDPLMPVRLRSGGRSVGGAMSWGQPKTLARFGETSPFFGLDVTEEVTVSSQVMAQPDPTLADRVIAALSDGTPLVTRKTIDQGQIVLFHITANAEWSSLPLSGLFVEMLERLAVSSAAGVPDAEQLEGTTWTPLRVIDGFGLLGDVGVLAGVAGADLLTKPLGADLHPGIYASGDRRIARNVIDAKTVLTPATWPADITVHGLAIASERVLAGALLSLAILFLLVDVVATLTLSGQLLHRSSAAALALALLLPTDGQAQTAAEEFALDATSELVLAHVLTGDAAVDEIAHAGMTGLSDTLFFRTSVEPANPIGVNLETDELAFFPLLYWPVTPAQPTPSGAAYAKLNDYLRSGGLILFDTRDSDVARFGASSTNGRKLQQLAAPLDIPALEPLPDDHVLTRTFYLLQDFPGRYPGRDIWVEAAPPDAEQIEGMPFRNLNDGVTPVVIGGNDWASAWAVNKDGGPMLPIGRGYAGERQREIAYRFGVNLVMHVLTGNYKSDQVHVPALLDRLGQ